MVAERSVIHMDNESPINSSVASGSAAASLIGFRSRARANRSLR
jgi:hypothetical protein